MNYRITQVAAMVGLLASASTAVADVKLPAIISDNMVIQRDVRFTIWGKASAGERVTVAISGQQATIAPDAAGRWCVELQPLKAGGPVEMTISGANKIVVKNILIGDVWLGSGQSNLTLPTSACDVAQDPADYPNIRLFTVDARVAWNPVDDVSGKWVLCTTYTAKTFSAVMFAFGAELHKATKVPVGLIQSGVGGSRIETWCSRRMYEANAKLKPALEKWDATSRPEKQGDPDKSYPFRELNPEYSRMTRDVPTPCYNAMIAPLVNYTIKGVVWYQGEGNLDKPDLYEIQLAGMIRDWRESWKSDFPFLIVQIPGYGNDDPNERRMGTFRGVQQKVASATSRAELVIAIDTGMTKTQKPKDLQHPPDKRKIGQRAALIARAIANGEKDLVYQGPAFESMKVEGENVRITFKNIGGGLMAGPDGKADKVTGFSIAGPDKKYSWTDGRIDGNSVIVSRGKDGVPASLRYGWSGVPDVNLYNKEGLPVVPFRVEDNSPPGTDHK